MIIKRRKDYEEYERLKHQRPWRHFYEVCGRLYECNFWVYPGFWREYLHEVKGLPISRKIKYALSFIAGQSIFYHGQAKTTEELDKRAEEFNARWRKMVESGAIERCFRDDIEAINIDIWGDEDATIC